MNNRPLTLIAIATSVVSLTYSIWLHKHSEEIAGQALQKREKNLVRALAPKVQRVYQGLAITNVVENAQTLEELFGPYLDVINRMTTPTAEADKKTP